MPGEQYGYTVREDRVRSGRGPWVRLRPRQLKVVSSFAQQRQVTYKALYRAIRGQDPEQEQTNSLENKYFQREVAKAHTTLLEILKLSMHADSATGASVASYPGRARLWRSDATSDVYTLESHVSIQDESRPSLGPTQLVEAAVGIFKANGQLENLTKERLQKITEDIRKLIGDPTFVFQELSRGCVQYRFQCSIEGMERLEVAAKDGTLAVLVGEEVRRLSELPDARPIGVFNPDYGQMLKSALEGSPSDQGGLNEVEVVLFTRTSPSELSSAETGRADHGSPGAASEKRPTNWEWLALPKVWGGLACAAVLAVVLMVDENSQGRGPLVEAFDMSAGRADVLTPRGVSSLVVVRKRASNQDVLQGVVGVIPGDKVRLSFEVVSTETLTAGFISDSGTWLPLFVDKFSAGRHTPSLTLGIGEEPGGGLLMLGTPAAIERARQQLTPGTSTWPVVGQEGNSSQLRSLRLRWSLEPTVDPQNVEHSPF